MMLPIILSHDDVLLFAKASHDRNPLHLSDAYARRTPFGRPVAFGVLALLAAAGALPEQAGALARLSVEFLRPVFEGIAYEADVQQKRDRLKLVLRDGGRAVLRAMLLFGPGQDGGAGAWPHTASRGRDAAREVAEIEPGTSFDLAYGPEPEALAALVERFDLRARGIFASHVAALSAASYLAGMECPGEQALFAKLALSFEAQTPVPRVTGRVTGFDARFAMLSLDVDLCGATGTLAVIVRPRPVELDAARLSRLVPESSALAGRRVVVVGGSRGIGAAIALALARAGAEVTVTYAAPGGSDRVASALVHPRIHAIRVDATDASACAELGARFAAGLDVFVACAGPPVLPMAFAASTVARLVQFVDASVAMVATPLAAVLDRLGPHGRLVGVSSAYVADAPPDFAFYAAAKGACEALLRAVAKERGLGLTLVRPPRVRTDMTATGMGDEELIAAEDVGAAVARAVAAPDAVRLLDFFPTHHDDGAEA